MTILKAITTGNGLAHAHRVVKSEIIGDTLQTHVHMYPSAETAAANENLLWQEYPALPLSALDVSDPWGSIERALIEQAGGLLYGGTFVADAQAGDLETARARKWAEIKGERDRRDADGVEVPGIGRFDSDAESRSRVMGAALAARISVAAGHDYGFRWTLADGSTAELDAAGVIGAAFALVNHLDDTHQRASALREQIQSAADIDAVAAIHWGSTPDGAAPQL